MLWASDRVGDFYGRIKEGCDRTTCSMLYSLIDRIDTSLFTGRINDLYHWLPPTYWGFRNQDNHQRAHFMRRRGCFLSSASAFWTLPTQTWYFCRIPNTYVTSLTIFSSIYSAISFIPTSITLIQDAQFRPCFYSRLATRNDIS